MSGRLQRLAFLNAAGMRAVLVPYTDIPAAARGPVQAEADAVVTRLLDLLPLVDAWISTE